MVAIPAAPRGRRVTVVGQPDNGLVPDEATGPDDLDQLDDPGQAQPEEDQEELDEQQRLQIMSAVTEFATKLDGIAQQRVTEKLQIEARWIEDMRLYHGRYRPEDENEFIRQKRSKLFIKLTRAKTNAWAARLSDMLFPTDDDNWSIEPVEDPKISQALKEATAMTPAPGQQSPTMTGPTPAPAQPGEAPGPGAPPAPGVSGQPQPQQPGPAAPGAGPAPAQAPQALAAAAARLAATKPPIAPPGDIDVPLPGTGEPSDVPNIMKPTPLGQDALLLQQIVEDAKKRASLMKREMQTQLRECNYNVSCRQAIEDACQIGSGIIKGPVLLAKVRRRWTQVQKVVDQATGETAVDFVLQEIADPRPGFERTDPWEFYPDMASRTIEECDDTFERHLMSKKQVRQLVNRPGFLPDQVRELLRQEPRDGVPPYIATLRQITHDTQAALDRKYWVWEYNGPIDHEMMVNLCQCVNDQSLLEVIEDDPLDVYQGVVWFCQGIVLKFGLHVLDSGDPLHSIFNLEKDPASVFGFGIPYLMRDSQSAMNGAWRMMMDNSGLSTGPQIVVNRKVIEPADESWELTPRKIWLTKGDVVDVEKAFKSINIDNHQNELAAIINLAKEFADEESMMPLVAQGEQGEHITKTMQGMALLMNSANVIFRRAVKNFDDQMTTPNIRRLYDWNMQFNPKMEIKGDFEVDARGSSVLMVRELQSQRLMQFLNSFSNHPVLGKYVKALKALRRLVESMTLPSDELVANDDEAKVIDANAAQQAQQSPEALKMSLEAAKMTHEREMALIDWQGKIQVAEMQRDTQMMIYAEKRNMTLDEINGALAEMDKQVQSRERIFAAELAMKLRTGSGVPPG